MSRTNERTARRKPRSQRPKFQAWFSGTFIVFAAVIAFTLGGKKHQFTCRCICVAARRDFVNDQSGRYRELSLGEEVTPFGTRIGIVELLYDITVDPHNVPPRRVLALVVLSHAILRRRARLLFSFERGGSSTHCGSRFK